jgi:hypothetical protein
MSCRVRQPFFVEVLKWQDTDGSMLSPMTTGGQLSAKVIAAPLQCTKLSGRRLMPRGKLREIKAANF